MAFGSRKGWKNVPCRSFAVAATAIVAVEKEITNRKYQARTFNLFAFDWPYGIQAEAGETVEILDTSCSKIGGWNLWCWWNEQGTVIEGDGGWMEHLGKY